ncbi:T9SS type A sorting domain-containing protein [Dyadobacter sediminis]|uniref:T9SS type A sorting domain-containing protein n=1 Tax=Dyadobacter sediminis TaxID=1493691 RepID=A0A5R9K894_9BACT|nr:T9SS type A sorting domain-containing protein [Dyadobacter sediminis]TLU90327.1 T9SS type A sorting domain-containing protein [Dyadobacter sediminis]GGC06916.1 hypothetical protein GCM10011325_37190 [Dyadobacter sediminis]
MKFGNLLLLTLLLCTNLAAGQNNVPQILLTDAYDLSLCAYAETKIPAQINGTFNSNNKFYIQFYALYNDKQIARYEAVYKNGNFVFTINDDKLESYTQLSYQISSTSPVTQTTIYSRPFYNRGKVLLSRHAGEPDTLNAGTEIVMHIDITTNNPVTVMLSDSSEHEILPTGNNQLGIAFIASKTADLFIVKSVNSCNVAVPFSGKVPVTVNPISIIPTKINNTTLCEGSEMELSYDENGGVIPETATFKLRFLKLSYSDSNEKRTFEIPAKRKSNGVLTARLPDDILLYSMLYQVAIVVDGPKLLSPYSKPFAIYEKPVASFQSQSDSVRLGEDFALWFNVSGPEPYSIELNNGNSYTLDNNLNLNFRLKKTETFSIKSLKTPCGVTTDLPKQTVVATVLPGIAIDAPVQQKREICENQKLRLPFVTNAVLNASTKFTVEGITSKNTVYQFEAKLVNDSIEFFIPHSPASWITEGYFSITGFRIKTANPSYTSEIRYGFTIRGIPRVTYATSNSRTLPYPQYYSYNLIVSGGIPFDLVDYKGEKTYVDYSEKGEEVFAAASGNFAPKSIENSCYANSDLPRLDLAVNSYSAQKPVIIVHPPVQKYLCDPDSIEVSFDGLGQFGNGNEFQITQPNNPNNVLLAVKKPGRYKLPVSAFVNQKYAFISIKSTVPEIWGTAGLPLIIESKPKLTFYEGFDGTAQNPIVLGVDTGPHFSIQLDNFSPYTAEYTDGTNDYHSEQKSQYHTFRPALPRLKVTAFTLKSLTNVCGTTDVNLTSYLYWNSYKLGMKYFTDNHVYCAGEEITVPFTIENGNAPNGTTFYLQVKKDEEEFRTILSNKTGADFRYLIPESMEGTYDIRVITDEQISTEGKRIVVNRKPSATISFGSQNTVNPGEIKYGQEITIDFKLTGGGPWKVMVSGMQETEFSGDSFSSFYKITKSTQFQLQSVSNQCGYGPVSGSAAVKVKPQILSLKPETDNVCSGTAINVKYQVAGDLPAGEKVGFYLTNANKTRFDLTKVTATSGTISLPVSPNMHSGSYELTCYITGTNVSFSQLVNINKAPDIELSGNATINPGEFAFINILAKSEGNQQVRITLSDGTSGAFQFFSNYGTYSIKVSPTVTTTYTIVSSESNCGAVRSFGSAKVIVNPPSDRTLKIAGFNKSAFCEKDTVLVYYTKSGTFSADNQFTVQIMDNQGKVAKNLITTGKESPLQFIVPSGFSTTEGYRIRLAATDGNTVSGDFQQTVWFSTKASASFASSIVNLDTTRKAQVVVLLNGTGPWRYSYGNDLGAINRYADISPDTMLVASNEPSAYFKLLSVSNACGIGSINEPSAIKVEVILGAEEPIIDSDKISIGPNPTEDWVTVRFATNSLRTLTLYNLSGIPFWMQNSSEKEVVLSLEQFPSGIYLLKLEQKERMQIFRIIKQ